MRRICSPRVCLQIACLLLFAQVALAESNKLQNCPSGSVAYGAKPPVGHQVWCRSPVSGGFIRQGTYTAYHRNGEKRVDGNYENNKPHGKWTTYDRYGHKLKEIYYYDGKVVKQVKYDKDGKPVVEDPNKRHESARPRRDLTDWSGRGQSSSKAPEAPIGFH